MLPSKARSCLPSDLQYSRRTPFSQHRDTTRTIMRTRHEPTSAWTSRAIFPTTSPVPQRSISANATAQHETGTAPLPLRPTTSRESLLQDTIRYISSREPQTPKRQQSPTSTPRCSSSHTHQSSYHTYSTLSMRELRRGPSRNGMR